MGRDVPRQRSLASTIDSEPGEGLATANTRCREQAADCEADVLTPLVHDLAQAVEQLMPSELLPDVVIRVELQWFDEQVGEE